MVRKGIHDRVTSPAAFRGKKVVIIGGGDSAFDWAQQLRGTAEAITLVHRSDRFRAHAATVADVLAAAEAGTTKVFTYHELHDIHSDGDYFHAITLRARPIQRAARASTPTSSFRCWASSATSAP